MFPGTRSALALVAVLAAVVHTAVGAAPPEPVPYETYLRNSAVDRAVLDQFLRGPSWAQFDPELGYVLWNDLDRDGMDGSATLSTVGKYGARTSFVYTDRSCRINTYGNSFTLCHQVSDAETWQEYLAGHLGEPIRNFGMGGYGVYQAWRRMLREEESDHAAEYVIFYIWGGDHIRSLLRCRHAIIYPFWDHRGGRAFHNNFWANVEMNLETGQLVERPNLLPTREALYDMTDPQRMVELLHDDLALQLMAFKQGLTLDLDREAIDRLAATLGSGMRWEDEATLREQAGALLDRYSLRATRHILDRVREFTRERGKKLLVVLFDPYRAMTELHEEGTRYDQEIVDYLEEHGVRFFDMNLVHLRDFEQFKVPFDEYRKRYFIGHYNPRGNHFFAYAIKDTVVKWLDPKPITYRETSADAVDFQGYLTYTAPED